MASYGYTFNSGDGVTPTRLNSARTVSEIVNADIKSDAAIAGTKIAPDFGSQEIVTSGALKIETAGSTNATVSRISADAFAANFNLRKARGSVGSLAVVSSGDTIGQVVYQAHDGTNYITAGLIAAQVDDTPGTNDMPGRLVFSTTADGASSATERMRIDSAGRVGIGTSSPNSDALLDLSSTTKGLLPPRMTTAQRNAIASPPIGLVLYDTNTNKLQVNTNTGWVALH